MKWSKTIHVSSLGVVNAADLRAMTDPVVVTCHGAPVAALVPYGLFQAYQQALAAGVKEE